MGPPMVAPYCARVKPGFLLGSLSMTGANALRAWMDLWRIKTKIFARDTFVPPFVGKVLMSPVERPRWPPMLRPDEGAGPMGRSLPRLTVEMVVEKPR